MIGLGVLVGDGMGLIDYNGRVFSLVFCHNCANLHLPCWNWLWINTIYDYILSLFVIALEIPQPSRKPSIWKSWLKPQYFSSEPMSCRGSCVSTCMLACGSHPLQIKINWLCLPRTSETPVCREGMQEVSGAGKGLSEWSLGKQLEEHPPLWEGEGGGNIGNW